MSSAMFSITNNVINQHHVPLDAIHWGHNISNIVFCQKGRETQAEGESTRYMTHIPKRCHL